MDAITVIGAIVGIIAGLFGIFYWIYTRRKDKKEKVQEKKEDKRKIPQSDLIFNCFIIPEKIEHDIIIGIPEKTSQKEHYFFNLPIGVGNSGHVDLENIKLIFKYECKSPLAISNEAVLLERKTEMIKVKRVFGVTDEGQFSTFHIKKLPPNTIAVTNEPINLISSILNFNIPLETKDGLGFSVKAKFEGLFYFELYFQAKDSSFKKKKFNIRVYPSKNIDTLLEIVQNKLCENNKKDNESKFPEDAILFYPDFKFSAKEEGIKFFCATLNNENLRFISMQHGKIFFIKYENLDKSFIEIPI